MKTYILYHRARNAVKVSRDLIYLADTKNDQLLCLRLVPNRAIDLARDMNFLLIALFFDVIKPTTAQVISLTSS